MYEAVCFRHDSSCINLLFMLFVVAKAVSHSQKRGAIPQIEARRLVFKTLLFNATNFYHV